MNEEKSLLNRVALVTGGSRGIGKAISLHLAKMGVDIAFNYFRHHKEALQTEKDIVAEGVKCLPIKAHLGDQNKIKEIFNLIEGTFGKLDILINNAASGVQRPALDLKSKHWDWTMGINAKAPWLCAQEAARLMKHGGKIINITSLGSQKVLPYYFSVGVSKASLEAITRYLAVELGPLGISVNAVSAGYIETQALDHFPNKDLMVQSARHRGMANRTLKPNDVAEVVSFLCSNEAEMIRGQILVVDGGQSLSL